MSVYRLSLNRCPNHGTFSVSLDSGRSGTRLTSAKCCGRWVEVQSWPMSIPDLKRAEKEIQDAISELEDLE